ncbi:MAG: primosomal protein N' [Bacteroidales bacterium]|nr:primosomal protein N' [Bacteroidales bacterium]
MSGPDLYAQVILPLAVEGLYTYQVPETLRGKVVPGSRVLVSFGKKRLYSAIVRTVHQEAPEGTQIKKILDLLDEFTLVSAHQLDLWDWISAYYMCTPGEVMRAALPSGLRPESESKVRYNKRYEDDTVLDQQERLLLEVVKDQGEVTLGDLQLAGVSQNPVRILKYLVEKGAVEINEFVDHRVPKKSVAYLRVSENFRREEALHALLDQLYRAPRQKEFMEHMLSFSGSEGTGFQTGLLKSELVKEAGAAGAAAALIKKGILEQFEKEEQGRDPGIDGNGGKANQLNQEQQAALDSIREQFASHQAVLLHGVTSSGKTELYVQLIGGMLEQGKQVLYMLPEIALTTQIIERIRQVFGSRVGVYHSRYSDSDRVHVYRNLIGLTDEEPYGVVIGVRSSIFLPFRELGLVIIDEEHENSYKQHDPAPRYHARDSVQVLALHHNARVLMGTATPSYESLHNARTQKYGYIRLSSRFGEVEPPEIILADIKVATKRKQMVSHFTPQLVEAIKEALAADEQVILFQNRRGFSHYIICEDCSHIPKCSRCDVSLTYHQTSRKLECHYCGHKENMPLACPSCGATRMSMKGFGTEKIEDELPLIFEGIRVGRLDTDTARSVNRTRAMINQFAEGKLDVLIGTQMLSKGFDFHNVTLVGVLDADQMLHFPDFRAFERSYQLIHQVSGRAGRRKKRGKVIVQTLDPAHPVIQYISKCDFEGLYADQMEERKLFGYPPFKRIIRISFRHKVPSILDGATDLMARELKQIFSNRVLGPQYPPVRKTHNTFHKQILLKIEREASYERARELLKEVLSGLSGNEVYRSVRISVDVDPY